MRLAHKIVLQKDLRADKDARIFGVLRPRFFLYHKDSGIATNCLQTSGRNFLSGISNLRDELNFLDSAVVVLKGFLIG